MNRLNRLSSILIYLQTRRVVQAQTLADRYGVSLRTIYRDIRSLEEAGVPFISEAGVGYSLGDYALPPVSLSIEEASALILGQSLIEGMAGTGVLERYRRAIEKIQSTFKNRDKEHLADLSTRFAAQSRPVSALLEQVEQAVATSRELEIDYLPGAAQQATRRQIQPIGLVFYGGVWHLVAHCKLREDVRDFRLDRIYKLTIKTTGYNPAALISLSDYLKTKVFERGPVTDVVVDFSPEAARYALHEAATLGLYERTYLPGQGQRFRFAVQDEKIMARWLLSWTGHVQIVSPDSLIMRMATLASEAALFFGTRKDSAPLVNPADIQLSLP